MSAAQESAALFPDLQMVIPAHVRIVIEEGEPVLRFSTGIANLGDGPLRVRALNVGNITLGVQEILDANGEVADTHLASTYTFHPEHDHWHIDQVALFELRQDSLTGPIVGDRSVKVTFCMVDTYRLARNFPYRTYSSCDEDTQGISLGWVDQYHRSLEGQSFGLSDVPPGRYFLINTANPSAKFLEKELENNTAWISFDLIKNSEGELELKFVDRSACDNPGMCGELAPDRHIGASPH
jgi:hypothetical protein